MATVTVVATIIVVVYVIYYHLHYKTPRTGAMYPRYMKGLSAYRTSEELYNSKSFICPWCRLPRTFPVGYKVYSWSPGRVFCQDCQKEIRGLLQADYQPAFTDQFSYKQVKDDARFWVICRDYDQGEIDRQKASELINELCIEQFEKQCTYIPTTRRVKSIRGVNNYNDGWLCGVCGKASNFCDCNARYTKDMQRGKYPKSLDPLFEKLQELDRNFSVDKYYLLADWQNLKAIEQDVTTGRCSADFAKNHIENYIALIVSDLKLWVNYFQRKKRGENPPIPNAPSTDTQLMIQPASRTQSEKS